MPNSMVPRARRTGNFTLLPNKLPRELLVDRERKISAVSVVDTVSGEDEQIRARLFAVCCGAIETARLLLSSLVRGICGSLIRPEATGSQGRLGGCRPDLTLGRDTASSFRRTVAETLANAPTCRRLSSVGCARLPTNRLGPVRCGSHHCPDEWPIRFDVGFPVRMMLGGESMFQFAISRRFL